MVFNARFHRQTIQSHPFILRDAEQALTHSKHHESDSAYAESNDPTVKQGIALKKQALLHFENRYKERSDERIAIQVPSPQFSPAGYSLFSNIAESFSFIGIPTKILPWHGETEPLLDEFRPTVILSSDHHAYLDRLDWDAITSYRTHNSLKIGLTASLEEYDNTPLAARLAWAKKHRIDFYYSFRDQGYVQNRKEYRPFFDAHYPMLFLPFGANVLHYYPVAGFSRDLNFALIATRKREHISYLKRITSNYAGFIDGPGWQHVQNFKFNRDRDRYIYARAKVGLNIHLPEQLDWHCELNERTYQLAACGVPQLIDRPLLLTKHFSKQAMFSADNPKQYFELFQELMNNPILGQTAATLAQQEVFTTHTTFHRASHFIEQLVRLSPI